MNWNNLKTPLKALVLIAVVALSAWAAFPVSEKIHLGLDLSGGSRLLLQLYPTQDVPQITSQIQEQTIEVIQRRINGLGVAEPTISKVGSDRILVELPNVRDPEQAEAVLKQVAVLEFKIVPTDVAQKAEGALAVLSAPGATAKQKAAAEAYVAGAAYAASGPVVYSGKDLKSAQSAIQQTGGGSVVEFATKDPAKFGKITTANVGNLLGIFLDKRYISAPRINSPIYDSGQIEGNFTQEQTITLANELDAGALPAQIKIIENENIGPTLGKIDLVQSLRASMLGLGLVLIFERIKEELWNGKTLRAAVRTGFTRAFSAVFDSHFTTIVGAGVLFMLGTGTVQGFAFTLFWGTVVSLFTAVFVTRFLVDLFVDNNLLTAPEFYGVKSDDVGIFAKSGA